MKTQRKILTGIIMTFMLSVTITAMFAQNPNRQNHMGKANREQVPPAPPDAPVPPPPPPVADIPDTPPQLDLPGLTGEQRDKIHDADLEHMKMMTPLHNQVREKKARLQTVLTTAPFDAKAADQVAEDLGKTGTSILKEMIRHDQALRSLLTPQQQVIFDARPKPFLRREK